MRIKSGIYDVLFSGTVIGINNEPIEFNFPASQGSLRFIIDFKNDDKVEKSTTEFEFPGEKTMKIILVNAKTSLGIGNVELIEIGRINNRKLYLNHRVYSIKELSKSVHYTFYLGEEVQDA